MSLIHFLLIYDHERQQLIMAEALGSRGEDAARKYSECEEEYRDEPHIEIVLVGADSLETIKQSHAHYFAGADTDPFAELAAH